MLFAFLLLLPGFLLHLVVVFQLFQPLPLLLQLLQDLGCCSAVFCLKAADQVQPLFDAGKFFFVKGEPVYILSHIPDHVADNGVHVIELLPDPA